LRVVQESNVRANWQLLHPFAPIRCASRQNVCIDYLKILNGIDVKKGTKKKRLGMLQNPEDSAMGGGFMRAQILEAVQHPQGSRCIIYLEAVYKQRV